MKKLKMNCAVFIAAAVIAPAVLQAQASSNRALDGCKQAILVEPVPGITDDFIRGVDISSLAEVEKRGGTFKDARGKDADIFDILKENGVNWIRLRVWNNPTEGGGSNSIETDIPLAVRAKKAGMKFLADFHYSDFWADPAKQTIPKEWKKLKGEQLNNAVEKFTRESINKFAKAGASPDMVQIGNELNNGFLWPAGKIWGDAGEKAGGMDSFISLLKSASKGVRTAQDGAKKKIVVHLADGANNGLYRAIFDPISAAGLDYDVIALSFYTYFHGNAEQLKANMEDLSRRYGKELLVAETAYAFTPDDGDKQGNAFLVFSDDETGYRPSVQGQATAVRDVIAAAASVKGGIGVFYWEPAWLPVKGAGLSKSEGCTWENQAMFDFNGRVLPSLAVWNLAGGKGEVKTVWGGSAKNGSSFVPYAVTEPLVIQTTAGKRPQLPSKIKVLFTNDKEQLVSVKWNEPDWTKQTSTGTAVKVKGKLADGFSFAPEAEVQIVEQLNLLSDPSFESGTLGEWKLDKEGASCFVENNQGNAHTGKYTYKYWKKQGFKSTLTRKVKGLQDGTYILSLWAMGGGGENQILLFAENYGGDRVSAEIINTGWKNWKQYSVEVPVTNGEMTIGIYLDTNGGNWGNFDDVVLVQK